MMPALRGARSPTWATKSPSFDIHGDHVYLLSHHEASRFKILGVDLPKDEVAHARVLMAASDAVVTGIQAAADALYVQKLDGGLGKLWRLPYEGGDGDRNSLAV